MKQAMALKSKTLQKTCQEYFAANTTKVLQSNTFLNFSQAALACLCDSETVNCTEKELFDACLKWAGKICDQTGRSRTAQNISAALGNILNKIKFHKMGKNELLQNVVPLDILSDEQIGRAIRLLIKKENGPQPTFK